MFEELTQQAKTAVLEIIEQAKIGKGSIFVVGCSSSTVKGENYGKASSMEIAQAIFDGIYPELKSRGIFLAAQCCEHLNRAIITEREAAEKLREPEVNVVNQRRAVRSLRLPIIHLKILLQLSILRLMQESTSAEFLSVCTLKKLLYRL